MPYHNDTIIKTQEDFFNKIYTSHFIVTFVCERELETEHNCNILTPILMAVNIVSFSFPWCSTGGSLCWLSLLHLISNFSGPQLIWAQGPPSAWCGFPYHISSITPSPTVTATSVLTELYNSPTSTQSPTRFLELHVWSSLSGNNCHAVHRSLSSGASVYECTMGIFFTSSHFISQFPPTRFPLITAIRMCHFLPVHHSEWHFWPGRRSKHNTLRMFIFL